MKIKKFFLLIWSGIKKGWHMMDDKVLSLSEKNSIRGMKVAEAIGVVIGILLSIVTFKMLVKAISWLFK